MLRFKPMLALAIAMLFLSGCFETELSLGPPDNAKVDSKLIGQWHVTWKDEDKTQSAELRVFNFNNREYYAEWTPQGEEMARINAYTLDVKGATFVQMTGLTEDSGLEEKHIIARLEMKDGKLVIRQLNDKFFENVKTDAELQKRISENLETKEMYAWEMTGTKKAD